MSDIPDSQNLFQIYRISELQNIRHSRLPESPSDIQNIRTTECLISQTLSDSEKSIENEPDLRAFTSANMASSGIVVLLDEDIALKW